MGQSSEFATVLCWSVWKQEQARDAGGGSDKAGGSGDEGTWKVLRCILGMTYVHCSVSGGE